MLMSRPGGGRQLGTPTSKPWGMSAALLGAWTLAHLADELQIDFEVALFNRGFAARSDDTEWSYTRTARQAIAGLRRLKEAAADRLTATVNHYVVKPFDRPLAGSEDCVGRFVLDCHRAPQGGRCWPDEIPAPSPPVSMFDKASNVDEFNDHAARAHGSASEPKSGF